MSLREPLRGSSRPSWCYRVSKQTKFRLKKYQRLVKIFGKAVPELPLGDSLQRNIEKGGSRDLIVTPRGSFQKEVNTVISKICLVDEKLLKFNKSLVFRTRGCFEDLVEEKESNSI